MSIEQQREYVKILGKAWAKVFRVWIEEGKKDESA